MPEVISSRSFHILPQTPAAPPARFPSVQCSVTGTVTVENEGLPGITVKLSGVSNSETLTDASGQYAFTGLRAGNYTIEITGFDDEDVAFGSTSSSAAVAVGESKVVSFEGTYLRTSGIVGQVTADEQPQKDITVSLQGRGESRTVTTNASGQFSFEQLRRGDYSVVISGYDTDEVSFDETSRSVTVAYGETANVPFEGILLRTAGIEGTVMVEGVGPIANVTVTITGQGESFDDMTDNMGAYAFESLPAGEYSVVISGFDDDEYGFPDGTSATVTVELQETGTVPFDGIMLRTAAIEGTVTVGDDGAPLPGVMVTVSGGPRDEEHATTTNGDGMYMVENLHAGTYSVTISGYDAKEYGFDPTTKTLTVDLRDTGEATFQGELLRTAGVSGRVHVDGMGLGGVTVTMTGEESREGNTDADGQYGFSGLAAGDYTLTISGWDAVEYAFEPTMEITLELDESMSGVNFAGKALRTATVMGSVTVEGDALPGIAVTLIRVVSANSGEVMGVAATDEDGGYSFGPLLAGAYQVMIAGYADEHAFADGTTQTTAVMTDGTASVNFAATIIRTASVSGMVTVDGEAMADVEVTLTGGEQPEDGTTMMTDEDGGYSFGGLRKGDYTVSIENPDADAYSFPSTSQALNLSVGQEQDGISFAGAQLRQASISGQVHAEGTPVAGVTVTLSGDADGEDMTDANGEYNFPSLAGGDYMVAIEGWDADAYEFATDEAAVEGLGTDEFKIVDFAGTHTRTASISGMLYIDAGDKPALDLDAVLPMGVPGLPITLLGPELTSDPQLGFASREGMYEFGGLRAGTYVVSVDVEMKVPLPSGDTTTVEGILAHLGYEYTGDNLYNVTVAAAGEGTQDLSFEITMQTIVAGAVMGTATVTGYPVAGVQLTLYPTTEAADAGAPALGTATTDSTGVATFHFPRAMDLGPGGTGNDHLVFAKVASTGHDDLVVSDNADIEIEYAATDRVSQALTAVRLLNNRANFQWWIKSDDEAKDGNEFLANWKVVFGTDTIATDADGKGSYSGMVALGAKPATMTVMADTTQADSLTMGEEWMQSAALKYTHNPLALPAMNADSLNDLGPIYITFETQRLTLGVYREADDEEGFTEYRSGLTGPENGDHRPAAGVASEMSIELLARDERNRLRRYTWDPDPKTGEDRKTGYSKVGNDGLVSFTGIPADAELTVRFHVGSSNRMQVDYGYDEIETFGDDLDIGVTLGAFGDMSGGQPEVRMCSASDATNGDATSDDWCATFGYQWKTGTISGTVGGQSGHKVELEPETGHGATDDDTKTGSGGKYSFTGLQDGEYAVTAYSNGNYTVNGTPTEKGIAVYHDEYTDDKDSLTKYVGTADAETAAWRTTQGGLSIMGFVANDGDGNNLIRGDEAMAGVEVKLLTNATFVKTGINAGTLSSSKDAGSTTTAANGLYSFTNLNDTTTYWVQVVDNGFRSLSVKNPNLSGEIDAEVYPDLPEESTYLKPRWDRGTGSIVSGTSSVPVTDDQGTTATTDDVTATMHNFALVYTDGTVSGTVNNMSGSNANIDIRVTTNTDDEALWERATSRSGDFEVSGLMEGEYTAVIEDAGWASPKIGTTGVPDDDHADDTETPDVDESTILADTSLTDVLSGQSDYVSLGVLHVYSTTASAIDSLLMNPVVRGNIQGDGTSTYNDTTEHVAWTVEWTRGLDSETTDATQALGTISYSSASVTFAFPTGAFPTGAQASLMVGTKACSGFTCTLEAPETPTTETSMSNTITLMVEAANGYDDHAYTVAISRAAPIDNDLTAAQVIGIAANNTETAATGSGTIGAPYSLATASATATSLNMRVALMVLGLEANDNQECAQSLVVRNAADEVVEASDDDDDDVCSGTRYNLTAAVGGSTYKLVVSSQDKVPATYYLNVVRGA